MNRTRSWWCAATIAAACLNAAPAPARAQQVKPYFLVVFDTSGSMDGDVRTPTNSANSCNFGGADPSKMDEAKCALGKIINATGDAEFGLMQFAQTDCGGASCEPTSASALLRVPIETNTAPVITALIDNDPADNLSQDEELCTGGYTPLGGTLVAAKEYYEGNLGSFDAPTENDRAVECRPLSVILLTDGVECCEDCTNASPWDDGCPKADATLSAAGVGTCPTACGSWGGCDNNDAFETAPEKAYELLTESTVPSAGGDVSPRAPGIQTYVIGFGIPEGDERIERIAVGGGTDNPKAGVFGFYADDETSLALAFSQIIADAQPPQEICNNLDDDCDELIDEGIPKFCDKPNDVDDAELCDEPDETLCDGEDDDCDGIIDEGVRNACGDCDSPDETCNGEDDDCDGEIDESLGSEACGSDEGRCEEGTLRCIAGSEQCEGEVGPRDERCNCEDDDCDGAIDEDVDNTLCEDGRCVACMCVPYCEAAEEFMPVCEPDRRPEVQQSGECLCIVDECDDDTCKASTLDRDGEKACAPDDPELGRCACRAGMCAAPCDGVTCGAERVCDKRVGSCVQNDCRGLGCPDGELCDPDAIECVPDACAAAQCATDEVCRRGTCEKTCAGVRCPSDEQCAAGSCVPDLCARTSCDDGEVCARQSGQCIEDQCFGKVCAQGLDCDPASGDCVRGECFGVRCPQGQSCLLGQCVLASGGGVEPGDDADDQRWLATGAGGCACRTAGGTGGSSRGALPFLALALVLALRSGRRRGRARALGAVGLVAALALSAGLALFGSGCRVEPFCATCVNEGGGNAGNAGSDGAGVGGGGGGESGQGGASGSSGAGAIDAGLDGAIGPCQDPEPEVCDGMDQDCDFRVDEDSEPDVNDCNQRGVCDGSAPVCLGGEWTCRYPDERTDDDTLCDGEDNDCDGRTDEDFPIGESCEEGIGACAVEGEQVCADDEKSVRCEIDESVSPEDEVCDGIDNDCDGVADEPKSDPGDHESYVQDAVVQVATSLWIYAYEASRPDASDDDQGMIGERACSKPEVLPWTNVTYEEARQACEAVDMTLCDAGDWQDACEGGDGCVISHTPSGGDCDDAVADYPDDRSACNGHDMEADPGDPDTDELAPTGSYSRCFTDHDGNGVFDLSGNAKEWTTGPDSPDENPLRGGSYNNLPGGLACDFEFSVAPPDIRLRNIGFRCCTDEEP